MRADRWEMKLEDGFFITKDLECQAKAFSLYPLG